MRVPINKIIEFSLVDGPGLRTSVFVQKCNISCLYCHNPETQTMCTNCAFCVKDCPKGALSIINGKVEWNDKLCIDCSNCIKICPNHASPKIKWLTSAEVFSEIKKNSPFIRGITVSGGECMLYPSFLEELFTLCKENNLSCLIDSNGTIDFSYYPNLLKVTDGVMLDVKGWDNKFFYALTRSTNEIVKKNLLYLYKLNKIEELRIVYHKTYVDALDIIKGIKDTIGDVSNIKLKLIKFRVNGVKGIMASLTSPTDREMEELKAYAKDLGFNNIEIR